MRYPWQIEIGISTPYWAKLNKIFTFICNFISPKGESKMNLAWTEWNLPNAGLYINHETMKLRQTAFFIEYFVVNPTVVFIWHLVCNCYCFLYSIFTNIIKLKCVSVISSNCQNEGENVDAYYKRPFKNLCLSVCLKVCLE